MYSLNMVTTIADCDALLDSANIERDELTYRKLQQERQYKSVTAGTTWVEAEISAVSSEIAGLEAVVTNLPAGPIKDQFESRLVKLRHKKFLLEERRERYGIIALLQKEYAISCIEKELVETDAYIDAVNARKAQV